MTSTAQRIVECASGELRERGLFGASLEGVRRRAGVSTGSAYHHFPGGMASVSAEVYRSTLSAYQRAAIAVLEAAVDAETGVRAGVVHLLEWVEADPARAGLLYQLENAVDPAVLAGAAQPLAEAIAAWIARFGAAGAAQRHAELLAQWIGPAKEYGRVWIRGRALPPPSAVAPAFAAAAWVAVAPFVREDAR